MSTSEELGGIVRGWFEGGPAHGAGGPPGEARAADGAESDASRLPRTAAGQFDRVDPGALPALPPVPTDGRAAHGAPGLVPVAHELWRELIERLEQEALALGESPRAAVLYFELGRLWEERLDSKQNAANAYQRAFHLDPRNLAVLHAARRLFMEVGNDGMVEQILLAEIDATAEPHRRATLLSERGAWLEDRLGREADALTCYVAALELWPLEPVALSGVEALLRARGAHAELGAHYARMVGVAATPEARAPWLWAAARLADEQLGQPEAAVSWLEQLLVVQPDHAGALARLRRLLAVLGRHEALAEVLARSALVSADPAEATEHALHAARIEHDRLGRSERALALLAQAAERRPGDLRILRELAWIYESQGRHEDLARVLRAELPLLPDPAARSSAAFHLAQVLEDRLGRTEDAIAVLEASVKESPGHLPALQLLGRSYERAQRFDALAALFELELAATQDPAQRTVRLFKLAELLAGRLGRPDAAADKLEELLRLSPGYTPALRMLEGLYREAGRWAELQGLYVREIELTDDVERQIFLWARVAELRELRLEDLDGAAAALGRILALRPAHLDALRSLVRLEERRERWAEVLRGLELEAEATSDQNQLVALLHRIGTIEEERLRDLPRATATYEKVLALSPGYLPALRSVGRLYAREKRWDELIAMYRHELEISRSPEHSIGLLFRIAELLVHKVGDDPRAIAVYREILERDPRSLPALEALAEIHARRGLHAELVEILARQTELAPTPAECVRLLAQIAELEEHKLARPERALAAHQRILELSFVPSSLDALSRLGAGPDALARRVTALERSATRASEGPPRARLLHDLARDLGVLGREVEAVAALEASAKEDPRDTDVAQALERAYLRRQDVRGALAVGNVLVEAERSSIDRAGRLLRMALRADAHPDLAADAAPRFLRVLEQAPLHPTALRALELAYRRAGFVDGLLAIYRREALTATDLNARAEFAHRAAELAELDAPDLPLARTMYRMALDAWPGFLPAIRGLRRIAEATQDAQLALDSIRAEREAATDPVRVVDLLAEAGSMYQARLHDDERAAEAYLAILALAPRDARAFSGLESIFRTRKASAALADLYERRAASLEDPDAQAELLTQAAELALDELGEPARGRGLLEAVLERRPMHPRALERIAPLLAGGKLETDAQVTLAIETYHKLVSVAQDGPARARGFRALGRLYEEHKRDLVKAVQSYQAAVQADPADLDSLQRLARVYRDAEDWTSSVNVLLRLAEVEQDPARKVAVLLDLGSIYERSFRDLASAALAHQKALEVDPTNIGAILRLAELHERNGDWRALGAQAEAYVRVLPPEERRRAVPLLIRVAEAYEQRLGDDARAIVELRTAQGLDPSSPEVLEALARIYGNRPETYAFAVDCHRQLLRQDPFRTESYHQMRRLFERQGELDKAFVICEALVLLRAARQDEDLFFQEHKTRVPSFAARPLTREEHEGFVVHPDERGPARAILEIIGSEAGKLFLGDLAPYELNPRTDRFPAKADQPVRRLADALAEVLGAPMFDLWITRKFDLGLFIENGEIPALIVGAGLSRRMQERELRFLLARQLERLRSGQQILLRLPPRELEALVFGAVRLARPDVRIDRDAAEVDLASKKLARGLSRKGRRALDELAPQLGAVRFDVDRQRQASGLSAVRAGFALTNDLEIVTRSLAREGNLRPVFADASGARDALGPSAEIRHLLSYAVSEEYFELRRRLQFSIQS